VTVSDKPEDGGAAPATAYVAGWTQTETLTALRELLDVSARVRPTVAQRSGLTQSELAERLDQPLGTIKSRMFTGLNRLRDLLAQAGLEESLRA